MSTEEPDLDYKKDLEFDRFNLDLELANIPQKFAKWSERLVDIENQRDRTKVQMELKYANLDSNIRANYKKYGFEESPNEKEIKYAIIKHQEYTSLQEKYLTLKHAARVLRVAVKGIKNVEKSIDREVKLYLAQYYMKPYGKETKEELISPQDQDATSGATAALNAHMKFRKR
jgi:hypothetical protein